LHKKLHESGDFQELPLFLGAESGSRSMCARTAVMQGAMCLGAGGGRDTSTLFVVLTGRHRAQVFIQETEEGFLYVFPLKDSLWDDVGKDWVRGAEHPSELFSVIAYASHFPPM
jgi:hypothetical protein